MSAPASDEDFGQLVAEHYERVFGIIYRLVGDQQEAEDLTQDTFVNAYRFRNGFRGDSQIYTWLYRIAVNLTRNRLEQRGRRAGRETAWMDAPEQGSPVEFADWSEAPDRQVANEELGRAVALAVLSLRPSYREVVILRDYEGMSYQQIARVVGGSVEAVKTRLFRARSVLRRRLASYLEQ